MNKKMAAVAIDYTATPPRSITTSELAAAVNALASQLRASDGGDARSLVAICMGEGAPLLLSMLSCWHARRPFLLCEPSLPEERLRYMLADTAAALVLHASAASPPAAAAAAGLPLLAVDAAALLDSMITDTPFEPHRVADEESAASGAELAYVCYTSGSTGRPKGVLVPRAALVAYARANAEAHHVTHESRVLLAAAVSFDPYLGEAFTALGAGATLLLPARAVVTAALGETLRETEATHVCTTPALWSTVELPGSEAAPGAASGDAGDGDGGCGGAGSSGWLSRLRCVALGGEAMSASLARRWAARVPLHNVYGVTECCVYQGSRRVWPLPADASDEEWARETGRIGEPAGGGEAGGGDGAHGTRGEGADRRPGLPRCSFRLIEGEDEGEAEEAAGSGADAEAVATKAAAAKGRRVLRASEGGEGELAIGGAQLADGYLGLAELTRARFVEIEGERLYLTGDRARWEAEDLGRRRHLGGGGDGGGGGGGVGGVGWGLRLLGRMDRQVQLNGLRLELGEVEGVLCGCALVRRAAVLVHHQRGAGATAALVALVEPACDGLTGLHAPHSAELEAAARALLALHASRWLAAAACPRRLLLLPELPVNSSGKLDRPAMAARLDALAAADGDGEGEGERGGGGGGGGSETSSSSRPARPLTALETFVAKTWGGVLDAGGDPARGVLRRRGADFVAMGGDSIKALQVSRALSASLVHASEVCRSRPVVARTELDGSSGSGNGNGNGNGNGEEGDAGMPRRLMTVREAVAAGAERADYGLLRGVFSPVELLRRPQLGRYAEYLRKAGVRVADDEGGDGAEAAMEVGAEAGAATAAGEPTGGEGGEGGEMQQDGGDAEAAAVLARLQSELRDAGAASELLQRALVAAARRGHAPLARCALALGAAVAPRPAAKLRGGAAVNALGGLPALHVACRAGHVGVVGLLLDASAPPTLLSPSGLPPLHVAAASLLLPPGAAEEEEGGMAASGDAREHAMEHTGATAAMRLLLSRGAPLEMRDDRRQTALHAAARAGNVAAIGVLVEAAAAAAAAAAALQAAGGRPAKRPNKDPFVELRDRWHRTALHWAVVNAEAGAVRALVAAGAAVNAVPMPVGKHLKSTSLPLEAPLHSAARLHPPRVAVAVVELLLSARADVGGADQFGQTALHVVAAGDGGNSEGGGGGQLEGDAPSGDDGAAVVAVLLRAGADPARRDGGGRTAAEIATAAGRSAVASALAMPHPSALQ